MLVKLVDQGIISNGELVREDKVDIREVEVDMEEVEVYMDIMEEVEIDME